MKRAATTILLISISICIKAQDLYQSAIPTDPKTAAMASTTTVSRADGNVHWNNVAAALSDEARPGTAVSYTSWQPDMTASKVLSASGFGKVADNIAVSAGLKSISGREFPLYDDYGNPDGLAHSSYFSAGVGIACKPLKGLSVGITTDYHKASLTSDISSSAIGIGIGGQYRIKSLVLGFKLSDLGSSSLPSAISTGASYTCQVADKHKFEGRVQASALLKSGGFCAGMGAEYTAFDLLSFRAGYYLGESDSFIPSHLSLGAGVRYAGIDLSASFLAFPENIGNCLIMGLLYDF